MANALWGVIHHIPAGLLERFGGGSPRLLVHILAPIEGPAIAQTGTIEGVNFNPINGAVNPNTSYDLSTFLGRGELGLQFGPNTVTYTMVYASGDSNEQDSNFDAFISTDVDLTDSMIFQENFMDDDYFAETPYILDKGYFLNKIQLDHKVRPNLKLSGMLVLDLSRNSWTPKKIYPISIKLSI